MEAKTKKQTPVKDDLERFPYFDITDNATTILNKRYLRRNLDTREVIEEPRDLFIRVAKAIAAGSLNANPHTSQQTITDLEEKFYKLMVNRDFMPNSPTLMNAGRELPNLSACFVLPITDSMEGIFNAVKDAAIIHKSGGGTGFDFSPLRPAGSNVKSTAGTASGPISFMTVFNAATETIKQGGVRRGANMGILRVDHPDIMEFICCKEDTTKFTNFNISVAITDEFMTAYKNKTEYNLYNPNGSIYGQISAEDVMNKIVHHAWSTGEPGVVFIDKINKKSTLPGCGKIAATNPCGEQPLLAYEACNLGSINVSNFFNLQTNDLDWDRLHKVVDLSILFLDNVIEVGQYPLEEIHKNVRDNRKIGLGVMGFADLLYKLRIAYNSDEGVTFGKKLMAFIQEKSVAASAQLAAERGNFANYDKSIYTTPMRNATVTTIAPTGTIGMLAEASGGIEPNFALVYVKQVLDGEKLLYVNPLLQHALEEKGLYTDAIKAKIAEKGSIQGINEIPEEIRRVFVTAQEIIPYYHVAMQSAFQEFVDSSISKTINFDNKATKEDILSAYLQGYDSACKGMTVYRDGCRAYQVLNVGDKTNEDRKTEADSKKEVHKPHIRPDVMEGKTYKVNTGEGSMYVTVNCLDGKPFEVFASIGKAGGNAAAQSEAVSRLVSLALRADVDLGVIVKQLIGIGSPTPVWHNGQQILSTPDAIGKVLKRFIDNDCECGSHTSSNYSAKSVESTEPETAKGPICPKCNSGMQMQEGCLTCHSCGYSKCS